LALAAASQPDPLTNQQVPAMPDHFLGSFLIFTVCVGGVVSYLILRARLDVIRRYFRRHVWHLDCRQSARSIASLSKALPVI
jgi:hypothetical protein